MEYLSTTIQSTIFASQGFTILSSPRADHNPLASENDSSQESEKLLTTYIYMS